MTRYRIVELKYPYGDWKFQIQRKTLFGWGAWVDCNGPDSTNMYATEEEARRVIDVWINGNTKRVVGEI